MIHQTTQGGKFKRLVRKLRPLLTDCPVAVETVAVGLLERLWHATIVGAMRGDIGRFDNEELAEAMGWHGDADAIVGVLTDERWLDRDSVHRLLVHDWHEHAPRHVKANAAKLGGLLTPENHAKEEPKQVESNAKATPNEPTAQPSDVKAATPNVTEPNLTKPNATERPEERPDGPPVEDLGGSKDRVILGSHHWRESAPTRERIARVVSGNINITANKLREGDYELCVKAAGVAHYVFDMDWLNGVLKSMSNRKTPPDNPWAFFRKALIDSAKRAGKDFHEAESRIYIPQRQLPGTTEQKCTSVG